VGTVEKRVTLLLELSVLSFALIQRKEPNAALSQIPRHAVRHPALSICDNNGREEKSRLEKKCLKNSPWS
jgi:hypothetical protein